MSYTLFTPLLLVFATTYATSPPFIVPVRVDKSSSSTDEIASLDVKLLAVNAFSLSYLERRLDAIREKLRQVSQVDHEQTIGELQARVKRLEGNPFVCID